MPRKAKDEKNEISKELELIEKKTQKKSTTKSSPVKKTSSKKASTATEKKVAKKAKTDKDVDATAKESKSSKKSATAKETSTTKKSTNKTTRKSTEKKETSEITKKKSSTKKATTKKSTSKKSTTKKATVTDVDIISKIDEDNEKIEVVEYYDLPYRYNQTVVKILAQTPNVLFVYWDISDDDRNNFVSQYGENFFSNTVPVLLVINKTMNYSYEVQINDFANSWYLHVNDANCEYQVELGRRNKDASQNYYSDYFYVTTSNKLDMPNDHILLENIPNNVLFKNVKTQELVEKPIVNISFFKEFAKSKDFYKYFKELLNDELEGDGINLNLPSSHTSSSFK